MHDDIYELSVFNSNGNIYKAIIANPKLKRTDLSLVLVADKIANYTGTDNYRPEIRCYKELKKSISIILDCSYEIEKITETSKVIIEKI